jgi:hypothetical protein
MGLTIFFPRQPIQVQIPIESLLSSICLCFEEQKTVEKAFVSVELINDCHRYQPKSMIPTKDE